MADRTKVFISYSRKDARWLKRLQVHLKPLEREGTIECWDDTKMKLGQWLEQIRSALAATKVAVLLVSADFLASDFIAIEELPRLLAAAEDDGAIILPVIVSPSRFKRTPLAQFQTVNSPDKPLIDLAKAEQEKILVRVTDVIEDAFPAPADLAPGRFSNVPAKPSQFFTGREALLEHLHEVLSRRGAAALTGMGGIGKTQLALAYAQAHQEDYQAVLWVGSASREDLTAGFAALAGVLKLPGRDAKEQEQVLAAVQRWLVDNDRWLLIFDNADDLELVKPFIPPKHSGRLLFTSRAQATGELAEPVPVAKLHPDVGALFLLRRARIIEIQAPLEAAPESERATARVLAQELGGLPLALDQAGAFIEERSSTLTEYLALYRQEGAKLRAQRGKLTAEHPSVAVTFSLAFEKLMATSPAAAELLRLCAFLHPEGIPEEVLTEGASELGDVLGPAVSSPLELVTTRAEACHYSLLAYDRPTKTLAIHRVVQAVLKDIMTAEEKRRWAERAVRVVSRGFPDPEFQTWPQCQWLLPHAQVCAQVIEQYQFIFAEATYLLNQTGFYLHDHGRYSEAEPLYERALAIREKVLGPEHPNVAQSLNNLAVLYHSQGCYGEAEPLYERALAIREQVLGPEHPDVALSLNNLAELYRNQGRYSEAEPFYQRALAIWEQVLGPEHPHVASNLNNLALLYHNQGRYGAAEPLCRRALAIWEQVLGPEHPNVVISLNTLASLYHNQGRYGAAEPLCRRALAICEQVLGPEHPDMALSLNSLAVLYFSQGRYGEAEPLYRRALAILQKVLGPEHPYVTKVLKNYAGLLRKLNREDEALALERRARGIQVSHDE